MARHDQDTKIGMRIHINKQGGFPYDNYQESRTTHLEAGAMVRFRIDNDRVARLTPLTTT